jgi:c-di-GMP phosphodiesterase
MEAIVATTAGVVGRHFFMRFARLTYARAPCTADDRGIVIFRSRGRRGADIYPEAFMTDASTMQITLAQPRGVVDVFIGRQPIFNAHLDVVAYELLFRDTTENRARILDGDRATARVFSNAFMELGLDLVTGKHPALINMTRDFVMGDFARLFPQERVLLEILEDVHVDAELVERVRALRNEGYRIVLDDFVYRDDLKPLVELAHMVKLDVRILDRNELREHVKVLRKYPLQLLAEKVETHDELQYCKDLGFHYFQGYFLSRPQLIQGRRPPADRLALLRLLARVNDPRVDIDDLEKIIAADISLAYKLLRYINSAFFSTSAKVSSIRHALVFLGLRLVRAWVNLVILSGIVDKPSELVATGMIRAKMCELLATEAQSDRVEAAFTVGLFSILEALMDQPMADILAELPLDDELTGALKNRSGKLGEIVACVVAFERGEWENVRHGELTSVQIQKCYFEALKWYELAHSGLA